MFLCVGEAQGEVAERYCHLDPSGCHPSSAHFPCSGSRVGVAGGVGEMGFHGFAQALGAGQGL